MSQCNSISNPVVLSSLPTWGSLLGPHLQTQAPLLLLCQVLANAAMSLKVSLPSFQSGAPTGDLWCHRGHSEIPETRVVVTTGVALVAFSEQRPGMLLTIPEGRAAHNRDPSVLKRQQRSS